MNIIFLNILFQVSLCLGLKSDRKSVVFVIVISILSSSFSYQMHWLSSLSISLYIYGFIINSRPIYTHRVFLYWFCLLLLQPYLDHFLKVLIFRLTKVPSSYLDLHAYLLNKSVNESSEVLDETNSLLPLWILFPLLEKK